MFTGLVEEIGTVERIKVLSDSREFQIHANQVCRDLKVNDSVAVNGVCLTVTKTQPAFFTATAVQETLKRSTLINKQPGESVNLERALSVSGRLGGHWVQGHVDDIGTVQAITKLETGWQLSVLLPDSIIKYCVEKGSIAIDGISLTIAAIDLNRVTIAVIPHTIEHTNIKYWKTGDFVNIEVDILAKYVERLSVQNQTKKTHDLEWYRFHGY